MYNLSKCIKNKVLVFLPEGIGGAEHVGVTIAKMLRKDNFKVKIVVIGPKDGLIKTIIPSDFNISYIAKSKYRWFLIYELIKKENPSVVFAPCRNIGRDIIWSTKLFHLPCKVIVRSDNPISTLPKISAFLIRKTFKYADAIIAQQEEMCKEIVEDYPCPKDKVFVLHNPIDYENIDEMGKAPNPYANDDNIKFLWVGRVAEWGSKGQDVLLKAFNIVHQKLPNSSLYFLGSYDSSGNYYNELMSYIKEQQLENSVFFKGFDSNPYKWIKHCECFVLPSRYEGLPNSLIEAMYLGIPVVATRCLPIISRMVNTGKNGFTVPVEDYVTMASAMLDAIKLKNCKTSYKPSDDDDFLNLFRK